MTELISQINWMGIVIGVSTFLIIGLFHPIVFWHPLLVVVCRCRGGTDCGSVAG